MPAGCRPRRPEHDDSRRRRGSRDGCHRRKPPAVWQPQVQQDNVDTLVREAFEGGRERGHMRDEYQGAAEAIASVTKRA